MPKSQSAHSKHREDDDMKDRREEGEFSSLRRTTDREERAEYDKDNVGFNLE